MTDTMQRWTMDALGREHLQLTVGAIPQPGPHEIRVKVKAIALNYRDKLMIDSGMGLTLPHPFIPGSDMAGEVDAVGPGVSRFLPGARVISTFSPGWLDGLQKPYGDARSAPYHTLGGFYQGVLAEYVILHEDWLAAAPASLDDVQASTLPCAGLTAWFALVEQGKLRAGDTVLVQGTGGVALFALQIAKAHGAEVYVTSGSDEKLARARALGADHGVNRLSGDWVETIYELTQDRGIDHVIDTAGGPNLGNSVRAVAVGGRISVIGILAGAEISAPAGLLLLKSAVIQGIGVGHRRALEDLVRAVDAVKLQPVIDQVYRFDQLPQALDHLDRGPFDKIVLAP